jgi:Spy/CpxP family protein refolding chaperone
MKRIILIGLVLAVAAPVAVLSAQRFARERGAQRGFGDGVTPSQVWRVRTLTMDQRLKLSEMQKEMLRDLRDARGDGSGRREMVRALGEAQQRMASVVTPAQLDLARQQPRGPLAPEEFLYYAIVALPDLDASRRAKVDAVYGSVLETARSEAAEMGGFGRGRGREDSNADPADIQAREQRQSGQRQRRIALFEVTEALLTPDQMIAVKRFLPETLKMVGMREKIIFRLPSLTLEQEAQVRAIFAALEDETAADKARLKALRGESGRSGDGSGRSERRELADRIDEREAKAYAELQKVLTPEQVKELAARAPGPPGSVVFTPEMIRGLDDVTPAQQARLRDALMGFNRSTVDERREARDLREQVKGGDPQSMELAGVRDQLRQVGSVLQSEHDKIVRTVADTLTGPQLAKLVATASTKKPRQP